MYNPFFPNPVFAWGFLVVLAGVLAAASYVDLKRMVIPKWITLTLLAVGFATSIARGACLGFDGSPLWILSTDSGWLGGLDGFLFALIGACAGFAVMFCLWILGTCGGGDVKLLTALGAWLGPVYWLYVLLGSFCVLFVAVGVKVVSGGVNLKTMQQARDWRKRKVGGKTDCLPKAPQWRISYSLPVAIATLAVLLWLFRSELQLTSLFPHNSKAVADAR